MTWIEATFWKLMLFILVKHSTMVPFKSVVMLVTDKFDTSGSVPLGESLEIVSEVSGLILMGSIIRVWICETITDANPFSTRGIVMLHLRAVAFALHVNVNPSPRQTDTLSWGSKIRSFPTSQKYYYWVKKKKDCYEHSHWPPAPLCYGGGTEDYSL